MIQIKLSLCLRLISLQPLFQVLYLTILLCHLALELFLNLVDLRRHKLRHVPQIQILLLQFFLLLTTLAELLLHALEQLDQFLVLVPGGVSLLPDLAQIFLQLAEVAIGVN